MNRTPQDFYEKGIRACDARDFAQGVVFFDQALAVDPGHAPSRYNRAKANYQLKNLTKSLEDFNYLVQKNPENAHYYGERAIIRFMLKDSEGCISDLDQAVALQPEKPYRYASRAFLKDRMGDLKGALKDYEKAIELDPEDAISYNNKGLVEEKMGYQERSRQSFDRADSLDPAHTPDRTNSAGNPGADHSPEKNKDRQTNPELPRPGSESTAAKDPKRIGLTDYYRQIKRLISSSEERAEFSDYLKNLFR